ncbi:uncharacterized protein BDR25DRAFT_282958 [Lindgomyces ingoldianus]|uniref:Uncharacterized protein n=1 Tax=Lindgomyces ingoldianus TaxID=673940 RepID=A0ACB6R4P7_9PLEO|nr:uncharacterized protein BDR25DRAFT_282958 [Lindgomyces ingoldianus]KAF2473421.1 hypothetical protein BDR25DRAFT_282958 [Lindgomyces ingoldianus]
MPSKALAKKHGTKVHAMGIDRMHVRGVEEWGKEGGREVRAKFLFGPSMKDLKPVLLTRDKWEAQDTMPSKREWGLGPSFYIAREAMGREVKMMREWYWGTGKSGFENGQVCRELGQEEGEKYLVNDGDKEVNVLLGAYTHPLLYSIKKGSFMGVAEPFVDKRGRRGWTFNLGARVHEAQWVPDEEGMVQYLAVAVQQKKAAGKYTKPLQNPKAPAFTKTKGFPTSIQIWTFESTEERDLDPDMQPRLVAVICTDWGMPRQFRWCPVAAADTVEPKEGDDEIHLGLLAGVWSDGKMRILDIRIPQPDSAFPQTRYIHFSKAAFEIQPPDTISTCIHWLSGTSIALGTTAGTLAIWTLTRPDTFPPSPKDSTSESNSPNKAPQYTPRPWFHKQAADTYILTISSGYPSRPHFISLTSADGFSRLFDLRSPVYDTISTTRARIFGLTQAWHEHTQSFLTPDENYLIRSNSIRRYYMNIHSMRMEAQILCCATSPVQPAVLMGAADGMCAATNPIPRFLNYKEVPWQQVWFWHEWRRRVEELPEVETQERDKTIQTPPNTTISKSTTTPPPTNKVPQAVLNKPLSRITEGYKVAQVGLQNTKPVRQHTDSGKFLTIFEEKTAVTCLAWNPNLKFGTWAVAGMADGLCRVEDLGI